MAPYTTLEPTLYEKAMLPVSILSTLAFGAYTALLDAPFRGTGGASTYKSHIGHAMIRRHIGALSIPQLQWLGAFEPKYIAFCKKIGQTPDIVTLKSGVKCMWLGERKADNVCLYFHGGGYNLDADDGHLIYWHKVQKALASGKSLSFLIVQYSLAPQQSYPTQLDECLEALNYLVSDLHREASTLLLAGDSAGGNMVLAVLSSLAHPRPDCPITIPTSSISADKPLKAAILIAPWCSFDTKRWPSVKSNAHKDIVISSSATMWSDNYLGGHKSDAYTEPILGDKAWWTEAGKFVSDVLCVAGKDELLIDQIDEFMGAFTAAKGGKEGGHVTYVAAPGEVHVQPILYSAFAPGVKTQQGAAIEAFLGKVL